MNHPPRRVFLQSSAALMTAAATTARPLFGQEKPTAAKPPLLVHSETPMNAETQLGPLVQSWTTPNEQFYIRSHAPVPKIAEDEFQLSIEGLVHRPFKISLKELRTQFGSHSVFATLTCAGNRRSEHSLVKKVGGVPWQSGAIGNARWTGPRLEDLLRKAGIQSGAKHVWFEGLDQIQRDAGVIPFGASVPLEKAMSNRPHDLGVLLAHKMNDQPLPPDHGFPLRTVVPGYIGARSVKWLGKIIVSDRPSENHYVATAYKLVTESTPDQWKAAAPLYDFVMNSVTCVPGQGAQVQAGPLTLQGYALPSGGAKVNRVEVSLDGGASWRQARLTSPQQENCWVLWEAPVSITAAAKQLIVRVSDSTGTTQPEKVDWNLKGYMFNAWHRTPLKVQS